MKRVLVTGAGGFVGRFTLADLAARGYEVHATDQRDPTGDLPGVTWHRSDLLEPGQPSALIARVRPSHLLHLAWYAAHGKFWTAPENLSFVQASLELVRAFREAGGTRVAAAGTCAEYDWSQGYCTEGVTALRPASLYGVAKDAFRRVLEAYARGAGLSWAWGRLFLLYGPGEDPKRLVASVIRSMLAGQEVRLSHGRQVRDFLYVVDVSGALVALLDSAVEGAVNICSGVAVSIRQVVQQLGELLEVKQAPRFGELPAPADDPPLLLGNPRRLGEEVGYVPRYDLGRGLQETVTWWRRSTKTP